MLNSLYLKMDKELILKRQVLREQFLLQEPNAEVAKLNSMIERELARIKILSEENGLEVTKNLDFTLNHKADCNIRKVDELSKVVEEKYKNVINDYEDYIKAAVQMNETFCEKLSQNKEFLQKKIAELHLKLASLDYISTNMEAKKECDYYNIMLKNLEEDYDSLMEEEKYLNDNKKRKHEEKNQLHCEIENAFKNNTLLSSETKKMQLEIEKNEKIIDEHKNLLDLCDQHRSELKKLPQLEVLSSDNFSQKLKFDWLCAENDNLQQQKHKVEQQIKIKPPLNNVIKEMQEILLDVGKYYLNYEKKIGNENIEKELLKVNTDYYAALFKKFNDISGMSLRQNLPLGKDINFQKEFLSEMVHKNKFSITVDNQSYHLQENDKTRPDNNSHQNKIVFDKNPQKYDKVNIKSSFPLKRDMEIVNDFNVKSVDKENEILTIGRFSPMVTESTINVIESSSEKKEFSTKIIGSSIKTSHSSMNVIEPLTEGEFLTKAICSPTKISGSSSKATSALVRVDECLSELINIVSNRIVPSKSLTLQAKENKSEANEIESASEERLLPVSSSLSKEVNNQIIIESNNKIGNVKELDTSKRKLEYEQGGKTDFENPMKTIKMGNFASPIEYEDK